MVRGEKTNKFVDAILGNVDVGKTYRVKDIIEMAGEKVTQNNRCLVRHILLTFGRRDTRVKFEQLSTGRGNRNLLYKALGVTDEVEELDSEEVFPQEPENPVDVQESVVE